MKKKLNYEDFVEAGRQGGEKVKKKYPKGYYSRIAKIRWANKKSKKEIVR